MSAPVSPRQPTKSPRYPRRQMGPRSEGEHGLPSTGSGEVVQSPNGEPLAPAEGEEIIATEDLPVDVSGEAGVEKIKVAHDPQQPSAGEVEDHRVSHYPFARWCRECVEGKALGEQHRSRPDRKREIPIIGLDYFFITAEHGVLRKSELARVVDAANSTEAEMEAAIEDARKRGALVKCLILRDSETKVIWAHVVPVKGLDEERHVLTIVCNDLKWLGHTQMIIRCDNEPALKAMAEEAILAAKARIGNLDSLSREAPEPYESQSNGMTEIGVRAIRAQFRTLKSCLERRLGAKIPVSHPMTA